MSDAAPQLVDDPSTPGRSVPKKKANAPFLAHRNSQAARGAAEAAQQQAGAPQRSLAARILKWSVVALLLAIAGGQFVAGDPIWGYRGKYVKKHYWFPPPQRQFTPAELALYDGTDKTRPIYLSIMGQVYDVTKGRRIYGPGGPYDFFAGRDASRAYVTGCFSKKSGHLTHDVRGLKGEELRALLDWRTFFDIHDDYFQIGKLSLPKVDTSKPPPPPCASPVGAVPA